MCEWSPRWTALQGLPPGYVQVLHQDLDPWTGSFSYVYPVDAQTVLKLTAEEGACAFLRMCFERKFQTPNLPLVYAFTEAAVSNQATGQIFSAILMERLYSGGTELEVYSQTYIRAVAELQSTVDCNVELSYEDAQQIASKVQLSAAGSSLSQAILQLAEVVRLQHWVLDLGNPDNWMYRRTAAGNELVLSDPVHHVKNFADNLV